MLNVKEGQTYICTKSDRPWCTVGKEYNVVLNANNKPLLLDDEGDGWPSEYLNGLNVYFKRKETSSFNKYGRLSFSMDELQAEKEKDVKHKYTPFEISKVIIKAYQLYDNDSQRLAYLKGYFDK